MYDVDQTIRADPWSWLSPCAIPETRRLLSNLKAAQLVAVETCNTHFILRYFTSCNLLSKCASCFLKHRISLQPLTGRAIQCFSIVSGNWSSPPLSEKLLGQSDAFLLLDQLHLLMKLTHALHLGSSFLTQSLTIPYQNEIVVHFRVLNTEVCVNGNHVNKQR